jgi:hypothetical protein
MGLLSVFGLFLIYVLVPGVASSFAVGLLAGVLVALFRRSSAVFLPTFARTLIGGTLTSAIAGIGGMVFVFFNAYILNNAAFQGQGMGYALLLVPVLSVVGAVLGGIGAIALSKRLFD